MLTTEDFAGQPPATVCGFDPLRDEGRAHARKPENAAVEPIGHADMLHGFLLMRRIIGNGAERTLAECGRTLARAPAVESP